MLRLGKRRRHRLGALVGPLEQVRALSPIIHRKSGGASLGSSRKGCRLQDSNL